MNISACALVSSYNISSLTKSNKKTHYCHEKLDSAQRDLVDYPIPDKYAPESRSDFTLITAGMVALF